MWLLSCYNSKNSRATFLCALPDNPIYKEAEHPRNPGFPPIKSSINLELWELIESRRGWGVSLAWRQWMSYRGTFDIFVIIPDKRTQNVAAKQPGCGFGVEKTKSRNIPHPLMIQIIFFKHWEMLKWCFSEPGVGGRGIKKNLHYCLEALWISTSHEVFGGWRSPPPPVHYVLHHFLIICVSYLPRGWKIF